MEIEILEAVLTRAGHRCAWCACKLNGKRVADRGTVCYLDASENDSSMVASCVACNGEFMKWRLWGTWSHTIAVQWLDRVAGTGSAPFVDYLEHVTGDPWAFPAALGRIEAQRNAPLDLRRKVRAA